MSNESVHTKDLIVEAWRKINEKSWSLFCALIIPVLILSLSSAYINSIFQQATENRTSFGELSGIMMSSLQIVFFIMKIFIYSVLAVSVHRIIILGQNSLPSKWGVYFTSRELKYMGWGFLCYVPVHFVVIAIPGLTSLWESLIGIELQMLLFENLNLIMNFVSFFLGSTCLSFFGLVLPGTAIEGSYSLKRAIKESKNIRIPLFIALFSLSIVVSLTGKALRFIVTSIDILNGSIIPNFINSIVIIVMGIFGIVLLSVTYEYFNYGEVQEKNS